MSETYPNWICRDCGQRYGNRPAGISTWHNGACGWCGHYKSVTEPRDYGHPDAKASVRKTS